MDPTTVILGLGVLGILSFLGVVAFLVNMKFRKFVEPGQVMIINTLGSEEIEVAFTNARIIPFRHSYKMMDVSVHAIEIERKGKEGLICKDNIRADIRVNFFIRVNREVVQDIIKVAQSIGIERASDPAVIEQLFNAKFSEALKTAGKQFDFIDLYTQRAEFREEVKRVIGDDLYGFHLEDAVVDFLEQTPKSSLDTNNILDAQGIKKITELTAIEQVKTNEFERDREKEMKQKNVDTLEKVNDLERQQSEAELKKRREIETNTARELSEIEKVKSEEQLRFEKARMQAQEELAIQDLKRIQEIELAKVNTERLLGIEAEKVERDRTLEAVNREREVELARISKERELEIQRKAIQDVIRERISVEKTVAEEEERIKTLRTVEEAKRQKDTVVIAAQAEGERLATAQIKAAEASEMAARLKAKEKQTMAEAELASADKFAQAKVRLAEGIQAEEAAMGLAEIKVKEADVAALEKRGMAEVRIKEADVDATEKRGMAEVRVKEAQAPADEKLGLAQVAVKKAHNEIEAESIQAKLVAEAHGIAEKAKAMTALNDASRSHEEFRLQMENQRLIATEMIKAQVSMAEHNSHVVSEAFKSAKFNIVGGDGAFMERILGAASMGRSFDSLLENSDFARGLMQTPLASNLAESAKNVASQAAKAIRPAGAVAPAAAPAQAVAPKPQPPAAG